MDNKELLRRLALLKANPKLAETIPQAEVFKMIQDVISAFNVLKTAIDNGKIKGEAGYTPIPDVDYPSLTRYDKSIEETITALETNYAYALDAIEKKLATVKDGEDGKDAVITDADKEEIAALAYSLITLPNFDELVTSEIPRNGEAIRDALELLQGDERYKVEIADVQGLQAELDHLYQVRGAGQAGGVSRNTVIDLIAQYGSGTGTVGSVVAGTGISVDNTDPANPVISATGGAGVTDGDKGDITVSGGGTTWTIDNNAVTTAKIADDAVTFDKIENISQNHFLGRHSAGSGDVQEVSPIQARTMLGLSTVATSGDYNDLSNRPDLSVFDEVEQHANLAAFPATGNVNKFYLAQDTGIMYRWNGSAYVVISAELALGETSSTAYRGDRGKIAYDHSQLTSGNPHNVTKSDVGLGSVPNLDTTTAVSQTHARSHAITSTSDHTATAHRVFYSDASGNITELALGASGTYLKSNGATSAPSFDTPPSGSGITRSVTVTSGNVTAGSTAATDYVYFVAGAHTVSLPAASGNTNLYTIKNNHSANITVDTVGAETIDGTASISVAPEESVQIISNGTNYFIV